MQKYLWCVLFSWTLFGSSRPEIKVLDAKTARCLYENQDSSIYSADKTCAKLNSDYVFKEKADTLLLSDRGEVYKISTLIVNKAGYFAPFPHKLWESAHIQCHPTGQNRSSDESTLGRCTHCGGSYYEDAKFLLSKGMVWTRPRLQGFVIIEQKPNEPLGHCNNLEPLMFTLSMEGAEIKVLDAETAQRLCANWDSSIRFADAACAKLDPAYVFREEEGTFLQSDDGEVYKILVLIVNEVGCYALFPHKLWEGAHLLCVPEWRKDNERNGRWKNSNWALGRCPDCGEPYYGEAKSLLREGMVWMRPHGERTLSMRWRAAIDAETHVSESP